MDASRERAEHSLYYERIRSVADRARSERRVVDGSADVDAARELDILRDGLGDVLALYVEIRTEDRPVELSGEELDLLHRATNDWLELYTLCHDVEMDASFTVREAAEVLVQTHDVRDVAQLLTRVPER